MSLGVRAPRAAVFVPPDLELGRRADLVRGLTRIWGGAAFAILVSDGESVEPPFDGLLRWHDPDSLLVFDDTVVQSTLRDRLGRHHQLGWAPRDDGLRPFFPDVVPWPHTAVEDALGSGPRECSHWTVEGDEISRLWVHSALGDLSARALDALRARSVAVLEARVTGDGQQLFSELMWDAWGGRPHDAHRLAYPFDLTMNNLISFHRGERGDEHPEPDVIVCGATVLDFAYFWTLRALRGEPLRSKVRWLPMFDTESSADPTRTDLARCFRDGFFGWPDPYATSDPVLVTSVSVTGPALSEGVRRFLWGLIDTVADGPHNAYPQRPIVAVEPNDLARLVPARSMLFDPAQHPGLNQQPAVFLRGEAIARLTAPTPSGVDLATTPQLQWVVEGYVDRLVVPPRPALTRLVVEVGRGAGARLTNSGFAFLGRSAYVEFGVPVAASLTTPELRVPAADDVFARLCEGAGFGLTRSDKGRYEAEVIARLGGLAAAARDLGNERVRRVVDAFTSKPSKQPGSGIDDWVVVKGRPDRGYGSAQRIRELWGDPVAEADEFLRRYIEVRLLHRGMFVKCPVCASGAWYPLGAVSETITCRRCQRTSPYAVASEKVLLAFDELFCLAFEHNSHIPLLALAALEAEARYSFLYTPGSQMTSAASGEAVSEVDFLASVDGSLAVGEGKAGATLSDRDRKQLTEKYLPLCRAIQPDWLVLATDASAWPESSRSFLASEIEPRLKPIGTRLRLLAAPDLAAADQERP